MLLTTVGRGGNAQAVRDEILNIMHRNKVGGLGPVSCAFWDAWCCLQGRPANPHQVQGMLGHGQCCTGCSWLSELCRKQAQGSQGFCLRPSDRALRSLPPNAKMTHQGLMAFGIWLVQIKEVKGTWMEEWHQKLHNNTTPDDVPICEAYLAFLASGGDRGELGVGAPACPGCSVACTSSLPSLLAFLFYSGSPPIWLQLEGQNWTAAAAL
jgi:hypothetical protein